MSETGVGTTAAVVIAGELEGSSASFEVEELLATSALVLALLSAAALELTSAAALELASAAALELISASARELTESALTDDELAEVAAAADSRTLIVEV